MITSKWRGHDIVCEDGIWYYQFNHEKVSDNPNIKCGHCHQEDNDGLGHDPCLGTLLGVMNACCGHGVGNEAYVQFLDGSIIHGEYALAIMNMLEKT